MTYQELKEELEQRLAALQSRLASLKKDAAQAHSADSAEQAQERENDEVVDAIGNETRVSIRIIQTALEKINEGTYGACEGCGEDIGVDRLRAVPEATHCVDCAE